MYVFSIPPPLLRTANIQSLISLIKSKFYLRNPNLYPENRIPDSHPSEPPHIAPSSNQWPPHIPPHELSPSRVRPPWTEPHCGPGPSLTTPFCLPCVFLLGQCGLSAKVTNTQWVASRLEKSCIVPSLNLLQFSKLQTEPTTQFQISLLNSG